MDKSGLLTSIWGPPTWDSLHCITFGYPDNPSEEDKDDYYNFFKMLRKVLPCCVCRDHYSQFITSGETELTKEVMKSKDSLTYWLYVIHCAVDKKLGMIYNISYEDLCEKYKSYIADCQMTPEMKIIPYKNSYNREATYVPYNVSRCFIEYAKSRGMTDFETNINKYNEVDKKSEEWIKRNENCWNIIKDMRIRGIHCVESNGQFEGLPTIEELQLLQYLSTTMSQKFIKRVLKKMGYKFVTQYKFSK